MPLLKSISGIRGTLGGKVGEGITPIDIVQSVAAYASMLKKKHKINKLPERDRRCVVVGRDGRASGAIIQHLVMSTLNMCGLNVVDIDLSTTPTVAIVTAMNDAAIGGIIITASHNPEQWNALKLLNDKGEFISQQEGEQLQNIIDKRNVEFVSVAEIGEISSPLDAIDLHIQEVLRHSLVDTSAIQDRKFKVVVDTINSTGSLILKPFFEYLHIESTFIHEEINGTFAHDPEPLPEHLNDLRKTVIDEKADMGIAVDPDVDRLCFIDEKGNFFGEEYTLVAVADYILGLGEKGPTVSNLSSSQALADISRQYGVEHFSSKVGEAHVVTCMKEKNAIIGGEGSGGIIVPDLHYGRDAVIGLALFLSYLATSRKTVSKLRATYPSYEMLKEKIALTSGEIISLEAFKKEFLKLHSHVSFDEQDGLKFLMNKERTWLQIRKSNTEPIIRIFVEAPTIDSCQYWINIAKEILKKINSFESNVT